MAEPTTPAPTRLIDWTGERCVPWGHEVQGIYEHLNRYYFAAALAHGKRVLDLASGEGYGAAILAACAETVVGVDVDALSIEHSRAAYRLPNVEFVEGDMLDLSTFDDGQFDLVVCFEALEHVAEHDELIGGIVRVLADGGVLVLSTPDRDAYAATLPEPNPFHVRELDRGELESLLGRHFRHSALWRQNSVEGSRLARLDDTADASFAETIVARRGDTWTEDASVAPMFYIGVASQSPLPPIPARAYLVDLESTALKERADTAVERAAELEQRLEDVVALERAARERASQLDARVARLAAQIDEMAATRGWQVLQVFRRAYAALLDVRDR